MPITIAMDTGGTFTDGIFVEGDRIERVKVDTTPHDLTLCFRNCIAAGAERFGHSVPRLLAKTQVVRFSTTVGTNSVIQRKGVRLGLLVTEGYADGLYAESGQDVNPLIPRQLIRGLDEKIDDRGTVMRALQPDAVRVAVESLLDEGARFIVASLRNSHLNPVHEQLVKEVVAAQYPRHYLGAVPVLVASDITIRAGDFTRTNTAILNAYLHPAVVAFLYRAEDYLRGQGYGRPLLIAHSTGGVARVAKTTAINTYNSGPVSGLLGARNIAAQLYDLKDLITMDVGGTSLDTGMVIDGRVPLNDYPVVDRVRLNIPLVEVETIGTGGGSIVRVNAETGEITVGPDSAGAVPGPAAFDLGGDQPTVTDADLVLGYLSADNFLGGQRRLRKDLAEQAIQEKVAGPLGISVIKAAWSIVQAVERQMGTAMSTFARRNGYDPVRFALFVYGGGGGLRCAGVSRHIGHPKAYLFEHSSAFSALGADTLDVMHLYEVNLNAALDDGAWKNVAGETDALVKRAERDMRGEGFSPGDISYQFEAITDTANGGSSIIELTAADAKGDGVPAGLRRSGARTISILRMRAVGATPHFRFVSADAAGADATGAKKNSRMACCDGVMRMVSVYSRDGLRPGNVVAGPAVVEANDTTYWVPDSASLRMDQYRNCILEVKA